MTRFVLIFLALIAGSLAGEVRLTLESAPAYALRHNPALAAARWRIEEARGRLRQAGRLTNPEVELDLSRNVRAPEGSVGVTFTQRFPLTARLRLEKAVTRAELSAAEAEVRDAERKVLADVTGATVKYLALGEQKSARERQLAVSRELFELTRKRAETGGASLADASLVELETQQLQTELQQLDVERSAAVGELRPLLGVPPGDTPLIAGTLPPVATLPGRGAPLAARPDFAAAQSTAEAARQNAALARAQKWQDVGVGFNVTEERTMDEPVGARRDTFVGLRFSLPLPLWNDNAGRIQEATAAAARARKEIDALAVTIDAETTTARDAMAILARLVASLETDLLPKAAQLEDQLRTSYSAGETALTEVIRARDRRLLIERQRVDALRDYHLARIRHAAATGAILPSRSGASGK